MNPVDRRDFYLALVVLLAGGIVCAMAAISGSLP